MFIRGPLGAILQYESTLRYSQTFGKLLRWGREEFCKTLNWFHFPKQNSENMASKDKHVLSSPVSLAKSPSAP